MARNRHLVSACSINARQNQCLVGFIPAHVGEGGSSAARVGVRSRLSPYEEVLVLAGAGAASVVAVYDETEGDVVVVDEVYHGG